MPTILRFLKNESGASAVEYGLIAGIISCVIINALSRIGARINTKFNAIGTALS